MCKYIGTFLGMKHFEDDNVPIGRIYKEGKKDGNKLGKRKRNLEHAGVIFYKNINFNRVFIHPNKTKELLSVFEENGINE